MRRPFYIGKYITISNVNDVNSIPMDRVAQIKKETKERNSTKLAAVERIQNSKCNCVVFQFASFRCRFWRLVLFNPIDVWFVISSVFLLFVANLMLLHILHTPNSTQCGNILLKIHIHESWNLKTHSSFYHSLLFFVSVRNVRIFSFQFFAPLLENHFVPFFASGAVCSMSRMGFPFIRALYIPLLLCFVAHVLFVAFVIFTSSSFFLNIFIPFESHLKTMYSMWNGGTIEVNTVSLMLSFVYNLLQGNYVFIWLEQFDSGCVAFAWHELRIKEQSSHVKWQIY